MECLPYIDAHSRWVRATPDRTWAALMEVRATMPGFVVEEACPPSRLALAGRHRFSRYSLVFELDDRGRDGTRVRALSWAAFPGVAGRAYRSLVIGSGAHRVIVRRLLRAIEAHAISRKGAR